MRISTKILFIHFILFLWCSYSFAEPSFVVKYLSVENVYLNGGKAEGLRVGDKLTVSCGGDCVCEIQVIFVADHSASCKLLTSSCNLEIGAKVKLTEPSAIDTVPSVADTVTVSEVKQIAPEALASVPTKSDVKPPLTRLTGSLFLQYYTINDQGASNLDFSQVTGRLSLKARELFGQPLTFSMRTRGRYDRRQRQYNSAVHQEGWGNRIWEFSFSYDNPRVPINLQVGRITPKRIGSAGYLDGAILETQVSENFRIGLFGGVEPRWAYTDEALSINLTGGYFTFLRGEPGKRYIEQSLAGVGEYVGGKISRELVVSQGRFNAGNRWGVYHTIELDVNRSWRKDKTDQSFSLSSLHAGTFYRFSRVIRFSVSYDNRTNYWTLESKSLIDSIFDDRLRQGARAQLDLTLPHRVQTSVSFGFREREEDPDATLTYSIYVNKAGLIKRTTTGSVQWASFDGPFEKGRNYSLRVSDNLLPGLLLSISYGGYEYSVVSDDSWRRNQWFAFSTQVDFGKQYSLSASVEIDNGDDIKGARLLTELGYRF